LAFSSVGGAGVDCSGPGMKSAEPRWPSELRSRVPYESRWVPYARAHEPGQGQLPLGSIRPRGYDSKRTPQSRSGNVIGSVAVCHGTGTLCPPGYCGAALVSAIAWLSRFVRLSIRSAAELSAAEIAAWVAFACSAEAIRAPFSEARSSSNRR